MCRVPYSACRLHVACRRRLARCAPVRWQSSSRSWMPCTDHQSRGCRAGNKTGAPIDAHCAACGIAARAADASILSVSLRAAACARPLRLPRLRVPPSVCAPPTLRAALRACHVTCHASCAPQVLLCGARPLLRQHRLAREPGALLARPPRLCGRTRRRCERRASGPPTAPAARSEAAALGHCRSLCDAVLAARGMWTRASCSALAMCVQRRRLDTARGRPVPPPRGRGAFGRRRPRTSVVGSVQWRDEDALVHMAKPVGRRRVRLALGGARPSHAATDHRARPL